MPLATFVALVQLMDNFRVFEPIVGFSAEANATSLSWLVYNDLVSQTPSSSARRRTSVLTIVGVVILLACRCLIRTWRDFNAKGGVTCQSPTAPRQPLKILTTGLPGNLASRCAFPFAWTVWGSFKVEA
jgi:hypothetical protein